MAPTITVSMNSVNIIAEPSVTISGDALKIGNDAVASWKDDVSKSCKVELSLTPAGGSVKDVHSGDKLSEEGKLQIKATDDAGNSSTADITLTKADTKAPEIEVKIPEKNVIAGVEVKIEGNQLFFDSEVAASWKDDYSETFNVELSIAGKKINSGDVLFDAGTLVLSVADEFQNKATAEITLTSVAIYGLENLQGKTLQVDQEVNLLEGLTITEGLTLTKVEIEENGTRNEVAEPKTYTPEYPGTVNIILTLARPDGSTIEVRVDNLTVKRLDYHAISLTDIKPVDVFPQIAQIEGGDPNIYSYVEDLRVAEAYVMREMMTEYGVGKYGPEEYQQLLSRVIIGLIEEKPDDYENYEWI